MKINNVKVMGVALGTVLLATAALVQADRSNLDPSAFAVDMDTAKIVALAEVPGTVVEAELEREHGNVVWEFEVVAADGTRMELLVDANSGELISSEPDSERGRGDKNGDDAKDGRHSR